MAGAAFWFDVGGGGGCVELAGAAGRTGSELADPGTQATILAAVAHRRTSRREREDIGQLLQDRMPVTLAPALLKRSSSDFRGHEVRELRSGSDFLCGTRNCYIESTIYTEHQDIFRIE
jgi:hypothetical protein